jgi:dienelactone hydrolase
VLTLRFVDASRTVRYADGVVGPRVLNTEVRYPAVRSTGERAGGTAGERPAGSTGERPAGSTGERAIPDAPPQQASGPFPLIVFGHGFELLPIDYERLLNSWARAGYVVAAPIFPAENKDAPGGPEEDDLVNQPRDMKLVISQMQAADRAPAGPLSGLINTAQTAVAGHSDGGDTALAVAYDENGGLRDRGVQAAIILSGAEIPFLPTFSFPSGGPPLLAVQGTADEVNPPADTTAYFQIASPPKYLLQLFGAAHLPPYTTEEPQLQIVERVSIDFLNRYLKQRTGSLTAMAAAANVPGVAGLEADR